MADFKKKTEFQANKTLLNYWCVLCNVPISNGDGLLLLFALSGEHE